MTALSDAAQPRETRDRWAAYAPTITTLLGITHPDALRTWNNLASWRGQAGDVAGAITAFAELLPTVERVLGPEHPNTLTTRNNLARWQGEGGDCAGAVTVYAELLPMLERVLGPEHPDTPDYS